MSEHKPRVSLDDLGDPICWYCGAEIEDEDQQCQARDGQEVCAP